MSPCVYMHECVCVYIVMQASFISMGGYDDTPADMARDNSVFIHEG